VSDEANDGKCTPDCKANPVKFVDSLAVIVTPAVALLAGGSATAAKTDGSSRQVPMNQFGWSTTTCRSNPITDAFGKHKG
jgi:hypothetical protein